MTDTTTSTKFTPGPWHVDGDELRPLFVRDDVGDILTEIAPMPTFEESEANARLIAAAPELLSVVARAARWWRMTNRNMPSVTAPWVSEANALLERVTGLSAWDVQDLEGRPVPVLDAPDAEGRAS